MAIKNWRPGHLVVFWCVLLVVPWFVLSPITYFVGYEGGWPEFLFDWLTVFALLDSYSKCNKPPDRTPQRS